CVFFSSRRRHTRFSRDWSSDVCSSDLAMSVPVMVKRRCACVIPGGGSQCVAEGSVEAAGLKSAMGGGFLSAVDRMRQRTPIGPQIGRASCREREQIPVVAGAVDKVERA